MEIRDLTDADVEFEVHCLPEDEPVRGNVMVSGDAAFDKKIEDQVLEDLEHNEWAWCMVHVIARWEGFRGDAYLGACSYEDEKSFKEDAYYESLKLDALDDLNKSVQDSFNTLKKLEK